MKSGHKMSTATKLKMSESQKRRLAGLPKRARRPLSTADRDAIREALKPFADECARQGRVTSYRDGDCRIIDCRLTIGHFKRLTTALALIGEG